MDDNSPLSQGALDLTTLLQEDPERARLLIEEACQERIQRAYPQVQGRVAVRLSPREGLLVLADVPDEDVSKLRGALLEGAADGPVRVCRNLYEAIAYGFPPEQYARCFREPAMRASAELSNLATAVGFAARQFHQARAKETPAYDWQEGDDATEVFRVLDRLIDRADEYHRWAMSRRERASPVHLQMASGALALLVLLAPLYRTILAGYAAPQSPGQFAAFVERTCVAAFRNFPLLIATLAKHTHDPGYTIMAAGLVRSIVHSTGRLGRALRASAEGSDAGKAAPSKLLDEQIATAIPLALSTWAPSAAAAFDDSVAQLRAEVLKLVEGEELLQDKQTTRAGAEPDERVAVPRVASIEAWSEEAGVTDIAALDPQRLGAISAEEEYIAVASVLERAHQEQATVEGLMAQWEAAGLSARECTILNDARLGRKPRETAKRLGINANTVSVQKHHAQKKVAEYLKKRGLTGS